MTEQCNLALHDVNRCNSSFILKDEEVEVVKEEEEDADELLISALEAMSLYIQLRSFI